IVLQPDGKLVTGGRANFGVPDNSFTLVRYKIDGSLDATFGRGGIQTKAFGDKMSEIFALAFQPDAKIVAAGGIVEKATGRDKAFGLARYFANTCGDGIIEAGEQCDDGNTRNGDGCEASCNIEAGFACNGAPSVCIPTPLCGNGFLAPNCSYNGS